jgi:predicted nuclease of predicted toxin-antitoxin system
LADILREMGHDVTAIAHDYPNALRDRQVLEIAFAENRILVTNDRDFGELVFRQQLPHKGILLFRLGDERMSVKRKWLEFVLREYADELANFIVITERGVRIRKRLE